MGLAQSQETPTEPSKKIRKVTPRLFLLSDVEFIVIAIVLNYFMVRQHTNCFVFELTCSSKRKRVARLQHNQ